MSGLNIVDDVPQCSFPYVYWSHGSTCGVKAGKSNCNHSPVKACGATLLNWPIGVRVYEATIVKHFIKSCILAFAAKFAQLA